jgi:hypothetical protein
MGNCGRLLRPPHARAHEYPNVKTAASQRVSEPWCQVCTGALKGRKRGHHTEVPVESEEMRLKRIRIELQSMIADRRRRGVPPEGIVMPGDDKMHIQLQRRMPGDKVPPRPRTPKLEETVDQDAPLGRCQKGHPFTHRDPAGRRVCATCKDALMQHRRRVAEARPVRDLGTCRRGHPFTHSNGGHKYCPTCKAMSRKKLAMKRAQASHER